jgi:hypothetical protein
MNRWTRWLLCGSLCVVMGVALACKKDEEEYGDNAATTEMGTEMTTEQPPTTEMGTEMGTGMGTEMGTDMSTGT